MGLRTILHQNTFRSYLIEGDVVNGNEKGKNIVDCMCGCKYNNMRATHSVLKTVPFDSMSSTKKLLE
jgi:hypothetical protein